MEQEKWTPPLNQAALCIDPSGIFADSAAEREQGWRMFAVSRNGDDYFCFVKDETSLPQFAGSYLAEGLWKEYKG